MGQLKGVPKIVGIPVPCCDPSVVELDMTSTLGPFQTLLREFEFKYWGETITIAGTVMSMLPNPSQIPGLRTLWEYVYVTTCS